MHVLGLLHRWSAAALSSVHAHRHEAVWTAVRALVRGRQLWLTALGRHIGGAVAEKHSIKRIDRLLGNERLSAERLAWYRWLAGQVVGAEPEPVVVVDWSDLDGQRELFLLRAAVAVGGRALPIYEEVHRSGANRRLHGRFLARLGEVLGPDCRPILVTDAGFRVWWFELVAERGWSYVGRVRNRELVSWRRGEAFWPNKCLHARASSTPRSLGEVVLSKSRAWSTTLTLYRAKAKGRVKLRRWRGTKAKGPREASVIG